MMSPSSSRRGARRVMPLLIAGIVLTLVLAVAIGLLQSMRDASAAVTPVPWPGSGDVAVLDTADPLPSDISGLDYEPDGADGGVLGREEWTHSAISARASRRFLAGGERRVGRGTNSHLLGW